MSFDNVGCLDNQSSFQQSLKLWKSVTAYNRFGEYVLVLTKKDLFEEWIKSNPFKLEGKETSDPEEAIQMIAQKFRTVFSLSIAINALSQEEVAKLMKPKFDRYDHRLIM
jgi:hypothetical protein